jgi:fibronectin-binding autotransporter adhesin
MARTTHSSEFQVALRPRGCDASRMSRRRWVLAAVSLAAVAAGAWSQPVLAQQTYTWAGNGTQLWGNSDAWVGAPSPLTFDNQTDIIFDNDSVEDRSNTISINGNRTIRSLTVNADFNTANNVTFDIRTYNTFSSGVANLTFAAANTGNASITVAQSTAGTEMIRLGNNNGGNVILSSNLDLAQHNTFFNANGLMFDGKLQGSGDINKTGAGHVRFVRNNSAWTGNMNINEGSVEVGNDPGNVFGKGTWTLGGGANDSTLIVRKFFQDGIAATPGGIVVADGSGTRTIANTSNDGGGILNLSGNFTLDKDAIFDIESHVVTTGDRMTLSGTVSGAGGIVKDGTGILILSASNDYSGTTDIQAGKLYLGGAGRLGSGDVTIASGANLDFGTGLNQTNIVANNISGDGAIIQSTASTDTRFIGDVTSTGGMQILNGTVRIGNGDTTGSYTGNAVVSSGASLAFARSDAYAYGGTISGAGNVSKTAAGDVTLTGSNAYSGDTALFTGALVAASADALGTGNIIFNTAGGGGTLRYTAASAGTDWATRIVNSSAAIRLDTNGNDVSLAGIIDSTNVAGLVKSGSGVLTLGGANGYTGTTTVGAGGLLVNGSLASTDLATVASGARIGGTGSLAGGLSILSGGLFVFNPADPTLDVTGAVTLDSTFSVASLVDSAGTAISWSSVSDSTYSLIGLTSSTFGSIANFGADAAAPIGDGRTAYFTNTTESGGLSLVVVPEPSTVALLGALAATGVLLARRRLR